MVDCVRLTREMLRDPIHLQVPGELDFAQARSLADRHARESGKAPMLLAWYNGSTGEFSPQITCCRDDKPAWLSYAESRGGDLVIDINGEAYVFVYRSTL
ncbi:MAG: AF1514 family protein [Thermodesulfobacteriota bacterium]